MAYGLPTQISKSLDLPATQKLVIRSSVHLRIHMAVLIYTLSALLNFLNYII